MPSRPGPGNRRRRPAVRPGGGGRPLVLAAALVAGLVAVPEGTAAAPPVPAPRLLEIRDGRGEIPAPGDGELLLVRGRWTLTLRVGAAGTPPGPAWTLRYRLLGFDDRWTETLAGAGGMRFTSLPAGSYRLEARFASSEGEAGPTAELLRIRVVRPWWWAPALAAGILTVAGLGAAGPLLRARALRRRGQRLQALIQQRTDELARALDDMERLALEDRLTGLPNRRRFHQEAERMAARAQRTGQDFTLTLTDVDRFKKVNDRWGHAAGDQVLQEVAHRLAAAARQTDLVCRYGGDEFVTLGWSSGGAIHQLAERMLRAVSSEPVALDNGERYTLRMSFGVCSWLEVGRDLDELFRCADQALYAAKTRGAGVVRWTPDLDSGTVEAD